MIEINNYMNKIFLKDIMSLLKELPDKSVDVVYGDPDYNVGIKYQGKSYTKSFDEYIDWYIELAKESLRVLKDTGNMFLINYPKQNMKNYQCKKCTTHVTSGKTPSGFNWSVQVVNC